MIDSVLKGTGNSRFLKSAVPAGTSWADALAMLQAGTFPIDFNGINTEGFQQVGTPLNKANLLKDATAAQIGLPPSTTPDGMFQALGNTGELHVWRKTVTTAQEIPAGYTLGDVQTGNFKLVTGYPLTPARTTATYPVSTNPKAYQEGDDAKEAGYVLGDATSMKIISYAGGSGYYVRFYTADSVSVSDSGALSIVEDNNSAPLISKSSDGSELRGKYIKYHSSYQASTEIVSGMIYFVPSNAVFTWSNGMLICDKVQLVTGYAAIPAGTTIEYLGKLGDKRIVQAGSYVGTGGYSSNSPNKLLFNFAPKLVIVSAYVGNKFTTVTFVYDNYMATYSTDASMYLNELYVNWLKNGISWYTNGSTAESQLNLSGRTYKYIAIG